MGVLAGYHLIKHWSWVKSVTGRLVKGGAGKSRLCYLVDAGVMLGMLLMIVTGIVISTWLSLPLGNYLAWRNVHVAASIATLLLVVLKIGMIGAGWSRLPGGMCFRPSLRRKPSLRQCPCPCRPVLSPA